MKVYVAAPYAAREQVRELVLGTDPPVQFTSSWIWATHDINSGTIDTAPAMPDDYARQHAIQDLREVENADELILFTGPWVTQEWGIAPEHTTSGGRHVETGYALALGKPVVIIGQPENIFHRGICTAVPDFDTAIKEIRHADNA